MPHYVLPVGRGPITECHFIVQPTVSNYLFCNFCIWKKKKNMLRWNEQKYECSLMFGFYFYFFFFVKWEQSFDVMLVPPFTFIVVSDKRGDFYVCFTNICWMYYIHLMSSFLCVQFKCGYMFKSGAASIIRLVYGIWTQIYASL